MDKLEIQHQRTNRILEISREMTATVSLESLLHQIVKAAAELTDSEVASILLLDEYSGELRFIAANVLADQLANTPVPVDASIAGMAFSSGKPQVISDARTDPRNYKGAEEQIGFEPHALLAVPLQFKDRRIGVLEVANEQNGGEFDQEDVETLTMLAAQATVAIENSRLVKALQESRDESERRVTERTDELLTANTALKQQIDDRARAEETLQRRNQELSVLLDTAQALSTILRLDKLLERALDELRRVVPYDTALIGMLRDEHWWIAASRSRERTSPKRFDLEELPLVQQVVRERGPVIVPDVRQEPNWFPVAGAGWIRSWLGVPLISRGQVVGALMVNSRHLGTYDQEVARLASTFGHHVALAIENSRLYEQARMRLREATLLHSVTIALSSTLDIDQILPYVTRSLCEILSGTSAEIYILDQDINAITLIANYVVTVRNEVKEKRRSSLGQTFAMTDLSAAVEALTRRSPLQVQANDPDADPRLLAELKAHDAQSMLLLPMVIGDSILGFSQVWDSQDSRRFTDSEIATGQMLIHQATITIDNTRLVEALRQRTNELQARNEELDAFAHTVAHDLKSPLSSIIGFGSFLEQTFTQMSDDAIRDNLQMITQSGQKMNTIIEELLLLASVRKMEKIDIAPLDMNNIVDEAQKHLLNLIEKHQAEIVVPDNWPAALGRGPWVEEVWANYISNAIKYGGRPPRIELGATKQEDNTVRFWVRDNGPGLAPEEQAQLFTPFMRLEQTKVQGHGLGLSIVQRIVEKMSGQVGVESEIGQGSDFFFTLPSAPQ